MEPRNTIPPRGEQRRSKRFATGLPVDLHGRTGTQRLVASDVGRHGLFVRSDSPAAERHVVRLTLHLPSGTIDATAIVARVVLEAPRGPGMGMQFFALAADAKDKWDRFIMQLEGQPVPDAVEGGLEENAPVFVVRLKDNARLRGFWNLELTQGQMTLFTPVLHPLKTVVRLVVVHPVTSEEFVLRGVVERVERERPKCMDIRFLDVGHVAREAFQRFIATGQGHVVRSEDRTPYLPQKVPPPLPDETPRTMEISVPDDVIAVQDERFAYDDASKTPLEGAVPLLVGNVLESVARADGVAWQELAKPGRLVRVTCDTCDALDVTLHLGGGEGALGLLSELMPMWCAHCRTLVAAPVATTALERMAVQARLDQTQRELPVPLGMLFDVAALSDPPTCPTCRMELKQNKRARQVHRKLDEIVAGALGPGPHAACACHHCDEGEWTVELLPEIITEPPVVGTPVSTEAPAAAEEAPRPAETPVPSPDDDSD